MHAAAVTRVGGLCIFLGWLTALAAAGYYVNMPPAAAAAWALCLFPAFAGGLAEDLTKKVPPRTRLAASFLSAGLAYGLLGASVGRIDVGGVDALLRYP